MKTREPIGVVSDESYQWRLACMSITGNLNSCTVCPTQWSELKREIGEICKHLRTPLVGMMLCICNDKNIQSGILLNAVPFQCQICARMGKF